MIRHFCGLKFKKDSLTEADGKRIDEIFDEIERTVPGVHKARVLRNCIHRKENMDLMIEMLIEEEQTLLDYLNCEPHRKFAENYGSYVDQRISFDEAL